MEHLYFYCAVALFSCRNAIQCEITKKHLKVKRKSLNLFALRIQFPTKGAFKELILETLRLVYSHVGLDNIRVGRRSD